MSELTGDARSLFANLPTVGNTVEKVETPSTPPTGAGTTPPATPPADPPTPEGVVEPTAEEIQTKLDELGTKPETDYTDEDKEYIKKYTQSDEDEITVVRKELEQAYGLTLETKYDNGPEGLKSLVNDVAPVVAKQIFLEAMGQIPHMREFYEHVASGKTLDTFLLKSTKAPFEGIELKSPDDATDDAHREKLIANSKAMLTLYYKGTGLADDDIESLITLEEGKGTLYDKSKFAQGKLKEAHTSKVAAQLKAEEDRIEADRLEGIETIKQIDALITKNDFAGTSIPAGDIQAFKTALLKPVDANGNTALDYKRSKLTLDQRVLIDYFLFKDFKNLGLAKKAESAQKTFTFKKALEDNNQRNPKLTGVADGKGHPQFNPKNLDFSTLMKR
jgi:hypothetical protein